MNYLTIPLLLFRRFLQDLHRDPQSPIRCPVGVSRWSGHREVIAALSGSGPTRVALISWMDDVRIERLLPPDSLAALFLGSGVHRGRLWGAIRGGSQAIEPIHVLRLVGPGMLTINVHQRRLPPLVTHSFPISHPRANIRWSRTIGAMGVISWRRLTSLRIAIIGLGRTDSSLALTLARAGVRELTLIDPDRVEAHNLGETFGLGEADLNRPKVEVVAKYLTAQTHPCLSVVALPHSITRLRALQAAQACDVLVSCVDHDSARLAASILSTVFHKPLLDIATGVHGYGLSRQMGLDVRLVLPGRCLLCLGGLRDEAEARRVLRSADAEDALAQNRQWQHERAGSLSSLNLCAVGFALRLLEDFVAGRLQDSTWLHLEIDAHGQMTLSYPSLITDTAAHVCQLCAVAGWGEEGLTQVDGWLRHGEFQTGRTGAGTT